MRPMRSREWPARVAPLRGAARRDWIGWPAPGEALERSASIHRGGESASGASGEAWRAARPGPADCGRYPVSHAKWRRALQLLAGLRYGLFGALFDQVEQVGAVQFNGLRTGEKRVRDPDYFRCSDLRECYQILVAERHVK
jgi:hypothetical protein